MKDTRDENLEEITRLRAKNSFLISWFFKKIDFTEVREIINEIEENAKKIEQLEKEQCKLCNKEIIEKLKVR